MTDTRQQFRSECADMSPEDIAFLSGLAQMIGAMYCRLHKVQETPDMPDKSHEQESGQS